MQNRKLKIAHLSSVHMSNDTRIVARECTSLAAAGFDVTVIISNVDESIVSRYANLKFQNIKKYNSRVLRWFITVPTIIVKALSMKFDLVHLHDPELIVFTPVFKMFKVKVVVDIHEDYSSTIKDKHYLPNWCKKPISSGVNFMLGTIYSKCDLVVCAWPKIKENLLLNYRLESVLVRNFPDLTMFKIAENIPPKRIDNGVKFLFSGVISFERGIKEAVEICKAISKQEIVQLRVIGRFKSFKEEKYFKELNFDWIEVNEWLNQDELFGLMKESHFGFILFHDIPNHRHSEPNKLFEYMAAGLPSVVNSLPLLKQVVNETGCGLTVNSSDLDSTCSEIMSAFKSPALYQGMREKGVFAVKNHYNWESEKKKLINAYTHVLSKI